MNDHDSPEAIEARANQEDPIIMYLIVRESLGMSIGKTAAQCAHASQMLQLSFNELDFRLKELEDLKAMFGSRTDAESVEYLASLPQYEIFNHWLNSSFRKVVLKADDKEWDKLKLDLEEGIDVIVVDAGLTEIASGSETVIGLWPMRKSKVGKLVKRLQVLK